MGTPDPPFQPPPTEAEGSTVVAYVTSSILIAMAVLAFISDIPVYYEHFSIMKDDIKSFFHCQVKPRKQKKQTQKRIMHKRKQKRKQGAKGGFNQPPVKIKEPLVDVMSLPVVS